MKLKKYINPESVKDTESIVPMFGLEPERWDELSDAVTAFFDMGGKTSESMSRFDEYMELRDENEIIAVIYMFGIEKGRFEGEEISREHGIEPVRIKRIHRVMESADWLKQRSIPITEYLKKFLENVKHHAIGVTVLSGKGLESLIAVILGGMGRPGSQVFSNKNKFKKENFDIPDPNKKPDSEGEEPSKES